MRPICPHCHSSNVTSDVSSDGRFTLFEQLCSQSTLSGLGVSICKYYKINSAIGVVIGSAMASAISLAKDKRQQPPLITLSERARYSCHTCLLTFTI